MRRIARLERSIDLVKFGRLAQVNSPYLCSICRHQASSFYTSATRAASSSLTDRLRKKIWGTDTPPGLKDPYGDTSFFDKTKEREAEAEKAAQKAELEEERLGRQAVEPDLSTYEAASTWDGLDTVGDFKDGEETWDAEHPFHGFLPPVVMTDNEFITAALHRALVEVFALKRAGKSLAIISNADPGDDLTMEIQLKEATNGGALIQFPEGISVDDIVRSVLSPDETLKPVNPTESEEDVTADRSEIDPLQPEETSTHENPTESEEDIAADRSTEDPLEHKVLPEMSYEDLIASWGTSWLQISLEKPIVKLAVLKRVMQLTGIQISDSALNSSKTVQGLLSHLVTRPKPRKVIEALMQKEELLILPNVSVHAKRITPIDKEKSLGRWKLIEQELMERDLPVTGHSR